MTPLPLTEHSQTAFAAYLSQSVSTKTIRVYLCALRFYQIRAGLPDPTLSTSPRLTYVLKGIQRTSPSHHRPQRLPVTPELLLRIHTLWSNHSLSFDKVMLWAAFCLGFFGFLRSGEFTSPSQNPNECVLSVSDVSIDSRQCPQVLTVFLRRSKTDQFGAGSYIHLGQTSTPLCLVAAVLAYLSIRPSTPGPLFIFHDGTPLSRIQLISHLRHALSQVGVNPTNFSGHSFRIGAASTAAAAGFSDSFIQKLGRWQSTAFTAYIRTPIDNLAAASGVLSRVNSVIY